jgi:hypothetical protein
MLQNHNPTVHHGFIVTVELDPTRTTPEQVALRLDEGLRWMEGTGIITVEQLGTIQIGDQNEQKGQGSAT